MLKLNKITFRKTAVFTLVIVIIVSIIVISYLNYAIIDVLYVNYDYKVQGPKKLGFNADTDALHFGIINQGGMGIRDLELKSDEPAKVLIKVFGGDNVFPNRNNFLIEPNKTTSIQFIAKVSPETSIGNYSGKIRIIFKRL